MRGFPVRESLREVVSLRDKRVWKGVFHCKKNILKIERGETQYDYEENRSLKFQQIE